MSVCVCYILLSLPCVLLSVTRAIIRLYNYSPVSCLSFCRDTVFLICDRLINHHFVLSVIPGTYSIQQILHITGTDRGEFPIVLCTSHLNVGWLR